MFSFFFCWGKVCIYVLYTEQYETVRNIGNMNYGAETSALEGQRHSTDLQICFLFYFGRYNEGKFLQNMAAAVFHFFNSEVSFFYLR